MRSIREIAESLGQKIDDQWIDNEKPVMTRDKRQAIIVDIDQSKIPNILKGTVLIDKKQVDYEWDDTGKCIKASDALGNPVKPEEKDDLVKGA